MKGPSLPGRFHQLEDKVRELAETCRHLLEARSELEGRICDLEEALKVAMGVEQQYLESKAAMRARIEALLSRLDQAVGDK